VVKAKHAQYLHFGKMRYAVFGKSKYDMFREEIAPIVPVKRLSTAEDVANAVLFLMISGTVTREIIHIDSRHGLV
jgi:NAD(P)-dependent dehydrogenase (short-subunit alcohol dehydrogenase family)